MSDAEVIVVGGGHNGLICAAYLARAGIDTLVVESRPDVGGCASTVSDLGARFNVCHCDHTMIRALPVVDELDLASHGLEYLEPSAAGIHAFHDRSDPWVLFHDAERTIDALAGSHPGQVAAYRRYLDDALPVAALVLEMARTRPTGPRLVAAALRRRAKGANRLWRWGRRSALDVLGHYFDDWHLVMPAISTGPTVWGVPADTPGTGLAALSYATRHLVRSGRPRGGSGRLTDATRASFEAAGGVVRCGVTVTSLVVADGAVRGVVLDDGTRLEAGIVVAACDPQRVLVDWIDEVPAAARSLVDRWRRAPVPQGYESKIDAVVSGPPARLAGLDAVEARLGGIDLSEPTTFVSPSPTEVAEAHRLRTEGKVAERPTLLVNSPSALDPSMRPGPDHHVLSLETLFTPYALAGGWPGSAEPERWLSVWDGLAEPGFAASIERWRVMTPDRYEREFAMHRGHAPSYGGTPLATLLGRRRELTRYRTPIDGLHLTGAGTFPGAGIFGASGRNAAAVVVERVRGSSLRRRTWGR